MADCARLYPLQILSRKWSYLLLRALQEPRTFSELQRELRFITNHILTRELKLLQEERLVAHEGKYLLAPAGAALLAAVEPIARWSVEHAGKPACPASRRCANCLSYPAAVGAREFVKLGKAKN